MMLHSQAKESQGTVPGTKGGVALTGWLLNSLGLLAHHSRLAVPPLHTACSSVPTPGVPLILSGTGTLVPSTCSRATDCPRAAFALCHRAVVLEGAKVQQSPAWAGGNQTQ